MKRVATGFTLVELLVVIGIVLVLIALFVPQIPSIMQWYRVHLSKVIMDQLGVAVLEYKRVYDDYPEDLLQMSLDGKRLLNGATDYTSWSGRDSCHSGRTQGYLSLWLALQGPSGAGWGPTEEHPKVAQFGPMPESPGFVEQEIVNTQYLGEVWGVKDEGGQMVRRMFVCGMGKPVLYYKAHPDSKEPHLDADYENGRYTFTCNKGGGATKTWWGQIGSNESTSWQVPHVFDQGNKNARDHWKRKLTKSLDSSGNHLPHNEKSFVLWMVGADQHYGYWSWSEEVGGYVPDEVLGDDGKEDSVIGLCDDIVNF